MTRIDIPKRSLGSCSSSGESMDVSDDTPNDGWKWVGEAWRFFKDGKMVGVGSPTGEVLFVASPKGFRIGSVYM